MSYGNKPQYPTRVKTILDDGKLKLSADPIAGGTGRPTLSLYVANTPNQDGGVAANPRIDVYTNVPTDKERGRIRAAMDMPAFFSMMELLKLVADPATPAGAVYTVDNAKPDFRNGKRQETPLLENRTILGKDKDGRIYISILSVDTDRPKIRFHFGAGMYHRMARPQGGEPLTDAEVSAIAARAWIETMSRLVPQVAADVYKFVPKDPNGGNGGGYNGNNNKPAPAASSSDYGDDLPF